jgi:GGDEF domain-containing protein
MTSAPRPLQVVVISQQVSLLHDVSWILDAVGYKVETSNDLGPDALWRRYSVADLVIVDGRSMREPTAATFALDSDKPHYRIFLYDPSKATDFSAWYTAGAHDGLRAPVSRGELLARVRTGTRFIEFERRLLNRSSRGSIPGMYSRRGFLRKLRKLSAGDELGTSQNAILIAAIDWYAGIRRKCGETAGQSLVNTAARAIKRVAGENAVSAYLGDGRFAALLVGQTPAAAKTTAESLGRDFGSRESHHESIPRPSLTSAVVPWVVGSNADHFLFDALETLALAEHSGGGSVVLEGEYSKEFSIWKQDLTTGNPFVNVVAQDIMEPFPAVLERDAQQPELAEAFLSSGVSVQPVVDQDGRLAGIAADDASLSQISTSHASPTLATPETIAHDASFAEILEAFSSRDCATLIVTAAERPLGYLTCDAFLSMIDPIHTETFGHTDAPIDELKYLIVPAAPDQSAATEIAGSAASTTG